MGPKGSLAVAQHEGSVALRAYGAPGSTSMVYCRPTGSDTRERASALLSSAAATSEMSHAPSSTCSRDTLSR